MGLERVDAWAPAAAAGSGDDRRRDPDADVRALTVARWHEVRRTCLLATGDPSDADLQRAAEDASAVGFAVLRRDWRRAQELAAPEDVALTAALAALAKDPRLAPIPAPEPDVAEVSRERGESDDAEAEERRYRAEVLAAARALTPGERAVLALVLVEGEDEHRAGEVLGVRPSTVRRRAERARAALDAVPLPPGRPDPLRVLADAADAVAPTRDPWALVLPAARAADRAARRRRLVAAGAGAAALLAVGGLVVGPVGDRVGAPARTAALGQRLESWPLRGPLAGDRAFSDAASEVTGATSTSRRLLWAGDVGAARVVLVLDTSLRPGADLPTVEAWTGPAGAAAATLTRTATGPVDPAVPVIAVAVDRSAGDVPGGDAAVPVLVVTPDAPRGGVVVDLSAAPGYAHDATVQRTYTPLTAVDGGAVGRVLPRQERTTRVRVRLRADGAPLYDGPLQVLPPAEGPVPVASQRLAAAASRGNEGDLPVETDQLAGLLRDVAVAHAADPAAVQVLHVWSGSTGTRGRALVAVVRTPDGATLQVVQEEQLTSTGPEREVVVSGRPVPTAAADEPVLWVSRLAPGRLRMVGVGAARAIYRGQSTLPVALDAHGFGEVRLGPPSFIVPQGYHVVTFYDRSGRILAEPAVPEPGSDRDPTDLHGPV
ncbi:MAG TPA: sigma factor-like helix-turn-helix DNA-binding protein [Motilibacteraceae bacterium]|nr:sigma factor-like helix-turn-helix DNA-binding protein [Motilibacteraceae bacterium]